VDPIGTNRLFLATDVGVYITDNLGASWYPLGVGLPLQAVFDLTLHNASRTLVAATHGRSQWKFDLNDLVAVAPAAPPASAALSSPSPNPTRGAAAFTLELSARGRTEVAVFDAMGRRVNTVVRGTLDQGRHSLAWNGRDERGRPAAAGAYYVRASHESRAVHMKRLVKIE